MDIYIVKGKIWIPSKPDYSPKRFTVLNSIIVLVLLLFSITVLLHLFGLSTCVCSIFQEVLFYIATRAHAL